MAVSHPLLFLKVGLMTAKRRKNINKVGYLFILPALILFTVFLIFPMLNAFRLSLSKWDLLGDKIWVGIEQFSKLFQDERDSFCIEQLFCLWRE